VVSSLFFKCNDFEFHIVSRQAASFVVGLSAAERARFLVACESLAGCLADGSPPVRSRLIKGAKLHGLFAILVDWPAISRPKLRLLAVRDRDRILIARGLRSRDGGISAAEVRRAEAVLSEHRGRGGERERGTAR